MPEPKKDANRATIDEVLIREANRTLVVGGMLVFVTATFGAAAVFVTTLLEVAHGIEAAALVCVLLAVLGLFGSLLARRGLVRGKTMFALFLCFVSLPTTLHVLAHYTMPAGAATYITGPFSLLYILLIITTGFVYDWRLSTVSGVVAAAEYMACFVLARPHLAALRAPDPIQLQDLTDPPIYLLRAMIMVFAGLFMGLISVVTRRHLARVLEEEQQKERVTRLFGEYVSPEVALKLVSGKNLGAGERKEVAVLFSDIRGFTSMSEKAKPEELVPHLNAYFDEMVQAIGEHGGVVDKFIGDAVMAVFGGVLPLEKPCDAAVAAARAMRLHLGMLNARFAAQGLPPLENGIGIHFGEVLQGSIGSRGRKDFTVIGDAVNTASRVEGLTKVTPQKVVITREVWERLSDKTCCVSLGRTRVKGKVEEVEIYGVPDPAAAGAK